MRAQTLAAALEARTKRRRFRFDVEPGGEAHESLVVARAPTSCDFVCFVVTPYEVEPAAAELFVEHPEIVAELVAIAMAL
jgi:hypothetical protein